MMLPLASLLLLLPYASSSPPSSKVLLPMSCHDLEDGYHFMKLLDDDLATDTVFPIVHVQCSHGYVMIDYAHDPAWTAYFSSWIKYHYAVAGPVRGDDANWSRWFLPDLYSETMPIDESLNGRYLVAPQCNACGKDEVYQVSGAHSAYYMSALAFGCFSPVRGWPACDMDYESYACKTCEWSVPLSLSIHPCTYTHL